MKNSIARMIPSVCLAAAAFAASAAVKVQMPPTCTNPDGLAVDPQDRLVIAAPIGEVLSKIKV